MLESAQAICEINLLKIIGFGNEKWRVGMLSLRYTLGFGNRPRTTVRERMLSATMQSRLLNKLKNMSRVFHARKWFCMLLSTIMMPD